MLAADFELLFNFLYLPQPLTSKTADESSLPGCKVKLLLDVKTILISNKKPVTE